MLKLLALTLALLPLGAQDDQLQRYIGKWAGVTQVQGKGKFNVNAVITRQGENLRISYASRGGANNASSSGVVIAYPKGDGVCYTANLAPKNSPMPMSGDLCLDEAGNLRLTSLMANGSAVLSETGKTCAVKLASPMGNANGTFKKAAGKKKRRAP
ncbi:MAG: hypothetical protein NDI60_08220 [Elusimicrobiales bacterium]|nr:hypothetical protein [Elusimicrobiales bacterium]